MAINIFEPLKFKTQGIADLATQESLVVTNGKISVDVVEPKKSLSFAGANFAEIEGKGVKWTDGRKSKNILYKEGNLWTDMSVNLAEEQDFKINDASVLTFTELGSTVVKSNLRQVGTLRSLRVSGSAEIGQFTYINSDLNRIGINTDSPGAAIGVHENDVDLVFGSYNLGTGVVGTFSNHHLEILTDNTKRITVSNNGDVRVHGKFYAEEIITQRSSPLVFKESPTSTNFGKGIIWSGLEGANKQFVLQAGPDRIWSTEIIDLDKEKYFAIEGSVVLSKYSLGASVTESSLTKLGVLSELQVAGDAAVTRSLYTSRVEINGLYLDDLGITTNSAFILSVAGKNEVVVGEDITIGSPTNTDRTVSVYGKLAVGVANPEDNVSLTVNGPVSFDNKKFETGTGTPQTGNYKKGDIIWNTDPKPTDYVGWICIMSGTPGQWAPFGMIASQ